MWFMNTVFKAGLEPIGQACANGNMKMVSGYLKAKSGPNITNENQLTLLDIAIENNHDEIAELIRKNGLFLPKDLLPLNPKNLKKV